ncbi:lytic transglycosylase domain-containing protein [Brevundimonas sp. NIBR11]|uniref:lytic transglycosylase domain-containing protein n=1 Tax=Brevundimonas sp. NIBR11 TaxID=3015999 RepID=UPI0022F0E52D|nr:lytic transglycosylase domain-containing protein [Brevundimonas sp. NIBR11]
MLLAAVASPALAAPEPYLSVVASEASGAAPEGEGEQGIRISTNALSNADRISYTSAFDALRRGDLDAARASARQAGDRVLLGQVEFERLFHPNYTASYDELSAWLNDYADLPSAQRVYALAMRRRPDGAEEPRRPTGAFFSRAWDQIAAAGGNSESDPAKAARVALNRDDLQGAVAQGEQIGDWWVVGLAAWRLGDYPRAFTAFERVAVDPTEDSWTRAGAGVWAARAAGQIGRQDRIQEFLRISARWPATFYGQIALRQLGEEPAILNGDGPTPYEAVARTPSANDGPINVNQREMDDFLNSDARARRTVAFFEIGRGADARDELRNGLRTATDRTRRLWTGLARVLGPRLGGGGNDGARIDVANYPMPEIVPEGGWTLERSLVYAIARKESGFNASARSPVGAYGLMQVMPSTAAEMTGDRSFVSSPQRLFTPATNVRLGQTYVNRMLARPEFQGDLLRAVASYNAGPGPMLDALRRLGPNPDPLLLIETIDVPQAREYVEKVVAAYWIYQRMSGGPLNTLDAVVAGQTLIPIGLDYVAPPPGQEPTPFSTEPVQVASATSAGTGWTRAVQSPESPTPERQPRNRP